MAELSHFLFNSDCPADKIAFMEQGSYNGPSSISYDYRYIFINTHIKTQLYAEGDYRIRGTSKIYPMMYSFNSPTVVLRTFMLNGECWIAIMMLFDTQEALNITIDYRVWAYFSETDAKNTDISPTANVADTKFIFTSDSSYPKFLGDGYISSGNTYTHSLGYIPYVKVWIKYDQTQMPNPSGSGTISVEHYDQTQIPYFGNPSQGAYTSQVVNVTSSQIKTYPRAFPGDGISVYYRMYSI